MSNPLLLQPQRLEDEMFQDLRYGVRMLLKNPGFTSIAVLTLALGIGANTAIFSVVNATLLRPPPYKSPDRIVMVWGTNPGGFGWRGKTGFSASSFLDYQQQNQVFERMATFNGVGFTLTGADNPEPLHGGMVTAEFFDVLAVQPILGCAFPEDAQTGQDHVTVLNYNLWQRRFGSDLILSGRKSGWMRLPTPSSVSCRKVLTSRFPISLDREICGSPTFCLATIPSAAINISALSHVSNRGLCSVELSKI
jgi:hypothetical protein